MSAWITAEFVVDLGPTGYVVEFTATPMPGIVRVRPNDDRTPATEYGIPQAIGRLPGNLLCVTWAYRAATYHEQKLAESRRKVGSK